MKIPILKYKGSIDNDVDYIFLGHGILKKRSLKKKKNL